MSKLALEGLDVPEKSEEILNNTKKSFGMIPNMYKNMAFNASLLDAYTYAYNSYRSQSGFNSIEQEVIFLSVAHENSCEYCVSVHSVIADTMSKVPIEITEAIRKGEALPDPKLNALSKFTRSMTINRGIVTSGELEEVMSFGYSPAHILGIITAVAVKTMSNYANHLTGTELDDAFKSRQWRSS